jgi:signal transduction protein with GAF and PtsI domain
MMTTQPVRTSPDTARKFEALLSVAKTLSGEIHIDTMLPTMIAEVSKAMGAERTSLFLYDETRDQLWAKVAEGIRTKEIRVPNGVGIVGMTAKKRISINISDAYQDARFNRDTDKESGFVTWRRLALIWP